MVEPPSGGVSCGDINTSILISFGLSGGQREGKAGAGQAGAFWARCLPSEPHLAMICAAPELLPANSKSLMLTSPYPCIWGSSSDQKPCPASICEPSAVTLLAAQILLSPLCVVAVSLAGRRWGMAVAGVLVGLPVVAGPILLVETLLHGGGFGADAAAGTRLGLAALTAFVVVYDRIAAVARPSRAYFTAGRHSCSVWPS